MYDAALKPGQYDLEMSSSQALPQNRLSSIQWISSLDRCDTFQVSYGLTRDAAKKLQTRDFPQEAKLKWQQKYVFKGMIHNVEMVSPTRVNLTYRDSLYRTKRVVDDGVLKNESLSQALNKISDKAGLTAKFYGTFSDILPSFYLGERSLYENLRFLSEQFGFFFYCHAPSSILHFMRLGNKTNEVSIDCYQQAEILRTDVRGTKTWKKVELRYFDSHVQETKERQLSQKQVYAPVNELSQYADFQEKMKWTSSEGHFETHAPTASDFDSGDIRVQNQLSKKAVFQQQISMRVLSPLCLPGDWLKLQNTLSPSLQGGLFLAHTCQLDITGSIPKMTVTAVRP